MTVEWDLVTARMPNQSLSQLVATNLDDGTSSILLSNLSTFTEATDFFHRRFALLFGANADSTPDASGLGVFRRRRNSGPARHRQPGPVFKPFIDAAAIDSKTPLAC